MSAWKWYCPTCGDHGFTQGDRPTFDMQGLLEFTHESAVIQLMQIVEDEMAKTSQETGHGKAQRAFGRKLLERFAQV